MDSRNFFVQLIGFTLLIALLSKVNNKVSGHLYNSPKRLNDFQSKHDLMQIIKKVNMHNSNDWGRLGTTRFGKRASIQSDEDAIANNLSNESIEDLDSKRTMILSKLKLLLDELI